MTAAAPRRMVSHRVRAAGATGATPAQTEILSRLGKAAGQLAGVQAMYAQGRYCIEVLDQLAAVGAAVDAAALLILEEHMHSCVREAVATGDAGEKVAELAKVVRRYVRSH